MGHQQLVDQLQRRTGELAIDVGRLRKRLDPDTYAWWLTERIAGHAYALHQMTHPTAAELAARYAPGDPEAITEAIRIVDEHHHQLQTQLGK